MPSILKLGFTEEEKMSIYFAEPSYNAYNEKKQNNWEAKRVLLVFHVSCSCDISYASIIQYIFFKPSAIWGIKVNYSKDNNALYILEDFENASPYFCTLLANRICD